MGLLGPNGAGKTTTMKCVADLIEPTEGKVLVGYNGQLEDVRSANRDALLDKMGFLIENPQFYREMTPRQLLTYFAKLRGYPRDRIKQRVEELVRMMQMGKWIDEKVKKFSKGMMQKIGVIQAIVHDPDFIVLDEPQSGLDPEFRKYMRDFMLNLKEQGKTIFLSSHLLYEVSEVADRVAIIANGKLLAVDTLDNLEALAKESIISAEISEPMELDHAKALVDRIEPIAQRYGEALEPSLKSKGLVFYDPKLPGFKIYFDGKKETQEAILKELVRQDIALIEYSVPKAALLERLYMKLMKEEQKVKKEDVQIGGLF